MAEKESAGGRLRGWFKALLGTLGGLVSGATVMYVTPFVDKAVKPPQPVANFKVDCDGLNARFQNLSTGGQGWWDFGDGTPLEPVLPDVPYVPHTYTHPGQYTAKMTLHNVMGDENDRSVVVAVEAPAQANPPQIQSLEAIPISRGSFAPATFRLVGQVQNAQMLVWDMGDDRPLEVVSNPPQNIEKVVTYPKEGGHVLKLAAFNGTLCDQKSEIVVVMAPPAETVTAILTATDQGKKLETHTEQVNFGVSFPLDNSDNVFPIDRQTAARFGFTIKEAKVVAPGGREVKLTDPTSLTLDPDSLGLRNARGLTLTLTPDRRTLHLTGELVRPVTAGRDPDKQPSLQLQIQLTEQRELAAERAEVPVTATLAIPAGGVSSSGLLPIPALPTDWSRVERKLRLELRDGDKTVWQGETPLPFQTSLTLHNRRCLLNATLVTNQVQIDLREDQSASKPAAD